MADELSEVKRETVGIKEGEDFLAIHDSLPGSLGFRHDSFKETDAGGEGAEETLFFFLHDSSDEHLLCFEFGIGVTHFFHKSGNEFAEEGFALSEESVGVANGTAKDATNDVARLGVGGQLTVGNGEGDGAKVVSDDTHGDVGAFVLAIFKTGEFTDALQDGLEYVGVIVRSLSLDGSHESLEAHAGVNDVHGEGFETAVGFAVELHKDNVPNLNDLRIVFVDERSTGHFGFFFGAAAVKMYFGAGTAGTGVAHFPEVVVFVSIDNVVCREVLQPKLGSLIISCETFLV